MIRPSPFAGAIPVAIRAQHFGADGPLRSPFDWWAAVTADAAAGPSDGECPPPSMELYPSTVEALRRVTGASRGRAE